MYEIITVMSSDRKIVTELYHTTDNTQPIANNNNNNNDKAENSNIAPCGFITFFFIISPSSNLCVRFIESVMIPDRMCV